MLYIPPAQSRRSNWLLTLAITAAAFVPSLLLWLLAPGVGLWLASRPRTMIAVCVGFTVLTLFVDSRMRNVESKQTYQRLSTVKTGGLIAYFIIVLSIVLVRF